MPAVLARPFLVPICRPIGQHYRKLARAKCSFHVGDREAAAAHEYIHADTSTPEEAEARVYLQFRAGRCPLGSNFASLVADKGIFSEMRRPHLRDGVVVLSVRKLASSVWCRVSCLFDGFSFRFFFMLLFLITVTSVDEIYTVLSLFGNKRGGWNRNIPILKIFSLFNEYFKNSLHAYISQIR